MISKIDVTEAVLSLEVIHGGAKFTDANHKPLWHIPEDFFFQVLIVSYYTIHQIKEVISLKDGIEVSYRWFASRKKAEAFAFQLKPSCS